MSEGLTGTVVIDDRTEPALSVVMLFPDGYESRRRAMRCLTAQTARSRIELVMVVSARSPCDADPADLSRFAAAQTVLVPSIEDPGHAFATGVRAARAPVVAYVEEHSFPEPQWGEALLRAHQAPVAAVGCAMGNANPRTLCSWANLFEEFGPVVAPAASGPASYLGGHHTSYKREVLLSYGEALGHLLDNETALHIDLRSRGYVLYLEGSAISNHTNISRIIPYFRQDYLGQRSFAASRAKAGRWSLVRRLAYVLAAPIIPLVRLKRIVGEIARARRTAQLLPRALLVLIPAVGCGTVGEVVGYLAGDSAANVRRKAEAELDRGRYLSATDAPTDEEG
jgi:hypothetical protein